MGKNEIKQSNPVPYPSLERQILNIVPHPRLHFETHLVEHCNLNCQMCIHFSPLAKVQFAKIESFSNDMQRLRELFGNDVSSITLLGGEPLLHPQVTEFLKIARTYFPYAEVILYTNGLEIPKMKLDFWKICKECAITITLTHYPISFDYKYVDKLLDEHSITYQYCNTPGREKKSIHFSLDLNGTQDPRQSFLLCDMANRCIFLRDGRLYTCVLIPNIQHFNEYFHQCLNVSPTDSIDIYQANNSKEIMHFLASPPSFCRYCDVSRRTILHDWQISKKDILEWT